MYIIYMYYNVYHTFFHKKSISVVNPLRVFETKVFKHIIHQYFFGIQNIVKDI